MADQQQNVIINFEVNNQDLVSTIDLLEKTGVIGKQAADALRQGFSDAGAGPEKTAKNIDLLVDSLAKLYKVSDKSVQLGIADALEKMGVTSGQLKQKLAELGVDFGKLGNNTNSARTRLLAMREEMVNLVMAGREMSDRYKELRAESGKLENAMLKVGKTMRNVGSDTRTLNALIGAAQGIAAGFNVAQGAAVLFGNKNEELQETLVRVNAAMSVLQGLQTIQNLLQSESATSLFLMSQAQTANVAATEAATGATLAWNAVLDINPIVAVTEAVLVLAAAFKYLNDQQEQVTRDNVDFESDFAKINERAEDAIKLNERLAKEQQARMRNQKKSESEIGAIELDMMLKNRDVRIKQQNELDRLAETYADKDIKRRTEAVKKSGELGKELLEINSQIRVKQFDLNTQFNAAQDEDDRKREAEEKKREAERLERTTNFFKARIAALKSQQLNEVEGGAGWRELQVRINDATASLNMFNTKLVEEKNLIAKLNDKANEALFSKQVQRVEEDGQKEIDFSKYVLKEKLKDITGGYAAERELSIKQKKWKEQEDKDAEQKEKDRIKRRTELIDTIQKYSSEGMSILNEMFEAEDQRINDSLQRQRDKVRELQDAGEITEKQAKLRLKRIDQAERQAQIAAAKRDKAMAVFQIVVNTAAAIMKAATEGFWAIAPIAALGAAQLAVTLSRPIPKFSKGKRQGEYEGFGWIGEAGQELHVTNKGAFLADRPTITYLSRSDTVYNARETAKIIEEAPRVSRQYQLYKDDRTHHTMPIIDYSRFGKEVGNHVHNTAVHITEKGLYTLARKGSDFYKYLSARRGL